MEKGTPQMEPYFDLGDQTFPITASSPEAQQWFDRGLIWCYGFNHEAAEECFRKAAHHDPECAMAYWGVAYAAGPNYNLPWMALSVSECQSMAEKCHAAITVALNKLQQITPLEQALIRALALRFPAGHVVEDEYDRWNDDYRDAMRAVQQEFPDHADVVALTVDAMMGRTPWQLWDLQTGEPAPDADTPEARQLLESAIAALKASDKAPHCGLLHFYIHLMEMSPTPEAALPAANALRNLVPDAGHLRHMPSHIDVLCGDYEEALRANLRAQAVNRRYAAYAGVENFYTIYRCHDVHFIMYAGMLLGQSAQAIAAAEEMTSMVPRQLLVGSNELLGRILEGFVATGVHAYIRFGEWQKIIDLAIPDDPEIYSFTTALLHYAKGVAFSALGKIEFAETERKRFEAACVRVPDDRIVFNNDAVDILDVARAMLCGELEYRKQNYDAAFAHLRRSVDLNDNLKYTEPWVWMQPARHALGALLLEQGHVQEAAAVYRADLGLDSTLSRPLWHPNNVWSLHGYHECLQRLGQERAAAQIKPQLDAALAKADITIHASCFCRTAHTCCDE